MSTKLIFDITQAYLDATVTPAHHGFGVQYEIGHNVELILKIDDATDALANVLAWLETAEHFPVEANMKGIGVRAYCEKIVEATTAIRDDWTEQ